MSRKGYTHPYLLPVFHAFDIKQLFFYRMGNKSIGEFQQSLPDEIQIDVMSDHNSQKVCTLSQEDISSPNEDSDRNILRIKKPVPADWEFNDLLENIAKQMTDDDLEEMKSRVKGICYGSYCPYHC